MTPARHLLTNALILLSLSTWTVAPFPCLAADTAAPDSTQPRAEPTKESFSESDKKPTVEAEKVEKVKAEIQPKADQILRETAKYYAGLDAWKMRMEYLNRIALTTSISELVTEYDIAVQKPNKISVVLSKGRKGGTVVSDGLFQKFYIPDSKLYMVSKAPGSLNDLLRERNFNHATNGAFRLHMLDAMVADDPYKSLMEGVEDLQYVALEPVNGVDAHHLKLGSNRIYLDVWVDAGAKPWILKVSPDYTSISRAQPALALTIAATYKDFSTDVLPPNTFVFVKPKDAKVVTSLIPNQPLFPPHPLLNAAAPSFEVATLSGKTSKLSDYKGKKIVILEWWTTWCAPCLRALPIIKDVAADFTAKGIGVEFLAVNLEQTDGEIKQFLKDRKLSLPTVLLDRDGKLNVTYKSQSLPQTIIIDKAGQIRIAKAGFDPDLKNVLTKELVGLLTAKEKAAFAARSAPKRTPRKR